MNDEIHERFAARYAEYRRVRRLDVPFRPGDHGSACPIDFAEHQLDPHLYQLEVFIGATGWKNRIVGLIPAGLLCITSRTSKVLNPLTRVGYYLNHLTPVPWTAIRDVRFWRKRSYFGIFLGIMVLCVTALYGALAVWGIVDGFTLKLESLFAPCGMALLFFGGLGFGIYLILISNAICIDVNLDERSYHLDTPRFQFATTRWFYDLLIQVCQEHSIPVISSLGGPRFESLSKQPDGIARDSTQR